MQNSMLNKLGFDPGILIILILVFMVFILIYLSSVSIKMSRFMKRYRIFMRGKDGVSLERAFESNFIEVDRIGEQNKIQAQEIAKLREQMSRTPVKTGIVKYDAFPDVGGRMSFALAMLDMNNTGFVMNAIHSKEGCYTYIKEIVKGESYIVLGQEEKDALRQAVISYENPDN
ncbi:MAG: DUF4446 family protein [Lachnospiraceae bacterium]|nr:DUF4446 family protein [Lachnospiraceae bacterium]